MILEILIALVVINIANRVILHQGTRLLYFTFILLGVHMLLISSFLWSELIFLFFTTVFIDQLQKSRENRTAFYFALGSGFLMCLQRNAGMFIATGAAIWVFMQEEDKTRSILKSFFLFFCVNSGLLIWNVYIWLFFVPHEYFNFSDKLFHHAIQNTESIAHALVNTFLPVNWFYTPTLIIGFFCLVYFLKDEIRKNVSLQLVFIITVVYLIYLYLVVIINVSGFQVDVGEADRFISVIVPFLGILVFRSYEKALETKSATVRALMMVLVCCWMSYPLARTVKNALQWHEVSKGSADR